MASNSNPTKKEAGILLLLFFLVPFSIFFYHYWSTRSTMFPDYLSLGNMALAFLTGMLLIHHALFKSHYLKMVFGCHGKAERCFRINGRPFTICARCSGMLVGVFMAFALTTFTTNAFIYLALGIPTILDGTIQNRSSYESTNPRRFITGLLFGPTLVFLFTLYQYALVWLFDFAYHI